MTLLCTLPHGTMTKAGCNGNSISWEGERRRRRQHFLLPVCLKEVPVTDFGQRRKRGSWRWRTEGKRAHSTKIEPSSNDVTLSLSLSWNSHGNWLSTSPQSASHPPSPLPTPLQELSVAVVTEAAWWNWRREGIDVWDSIIILQWADVSPTHKQHVHASVLWARQRNAAQWGRAFTKVHIQMWLWKMQF